METGFEVSRKELEDVGMYETARDAPWLRVFMLSDPWLLFLPEVLPTCDPSDEGR